MAEEEVVRGRDYRVSAREGYLDPPSIPEERLPLAKEAAMRAEQKFSLLANRRVPNREDLERDVLRLYELAGEPPPLAVVIAPNPHIYLLVRQLYLGMLSRLGYATSLLNPPPGAAQSSMPVLLHLASELLGTSVRSQWGQWGLGLPVTGDGGRHTLLSFAAFAQMLKRWMGAIGGMGTTKITWRNTLGGFRVSGHWMAETEVASYLYWPLRHALMAVGYEDKVMVNVVGERLDYMALLNPLRMHFYKVYDQLPVQEVEYPRGGHLTLGGISPALALAIPVDSGYEEFEWNPATNAAVEMAVSLIHYWSSPEMARDPMPLSKAMIGLVDQATAVWPARGLCLILPKPNRLHYDRQFRLHADGKPALSWPGYDIYAQEGITLPAAIGANPVKDWRAQWAINTPNAEVRGLIFRKIGKEKFIDELGGQAISRWREYTLYVVHTSEMRREGLNLLEMICPSTGKRHVLRVPPTIRDARAAATWVNNGIDPAAFDIEQ